MTRKLFLGGFVGVLAFILLAGIFVTPDVYATPENVKVLIAFTRQPGTPEQALVRGAGGIIKYTYHIVPAIAATIPEAAIAGLRANPNVAYVEEDGRVYATLETLPWGVDRIDAELVHPYNKGTGVKVSIIDTGIDYTHPDLYANYKGGYDYVNDDAYPLDDNGHGTHCAGIIAAEGNDIGAIGVAPEAWLYAVKVLDATGSGSLSDVVAGIQWSVDNSMQVTSMSLGTNTDYVTLHAACDAAYAAGIVVVAAAGNDYSLRGRAEVDTVDYPARYGSVIAVGATDNTDTKASFSSTGAALELAAPGVSIYSTLPTYKVTLSANYGYNYGTLSGTSMSCPHVAGTAALVMLSEPTFTNVQVRQRLQSTADDLGATGRDYWYGYGLVDADEAAPLAPTATGSIAGKVTNASDGTVIGGATVIVDTGQLVTTAADGTYTISGVPTGDHSVTASAVGFVSQTRTATVAKDLTVTVDFALIPAAAPSNIMSVNSITFSAKKASFNLTLYTTVKVVLEDGSLVEGAKVEMTLTHASGSWNFAGNTGTDGTIKFTLLKARTGDYTAKVTKVSHTVYAWDGIQATASCKLDSNGKVIQGAAKPVASTSPANSLGNYPNPANPETSILYSINQSGQVTLKVYNNLGQLIRTLVDEVKAPGTYAVHWDGKDERGFNVSSGVYLYQLRSDTYVDTKTMSIIR